MKKKFNLIMAATITVAITLGLVGCGNNKSNNKEEKKVNIGYFPNINHSQALLIKAENKNPNWNFKKFNSGPSALEALLAGGVDITYTGTQPALNGYIKTNGDVVVVSAVANGGAALISKDKNIKSIEQLKGKKVAVPEYGNSQDLLLRVLLKEHGLKDKKDGGDIEIIAAPNPDIKLLFERGDIDAALVPEPWASELRLIGNEVYNQEKIISVGNFATAVILVRKDFLEKHPEEVKKLLEQHYKATKKINDDKEGVSIVIANEIKKDTGKKLSKDLILSALNKIEFTVDPLYKEGQYLADTAYDLGLIKKKINIKELYKLDLINSIKKGE